MSATGESVNHFNQTALPPAFTSGITLSPSVQIVSPVLPPAAPIVIPEVETRLQKEAFQVYLNMGPERSFDKVAKARNFRVGEKGIREWAEIWDWAGRIRDQEDGLRDKKVLAIVDSLISEIEFGREGIFIVDPEKPGKFKIDPEYVKTLGVRTKSTEDRLEVIERLRGRIVSRIHEKQQMKQQQEEADAVPPEERGSSGGGRQMVIVNITGR